MDREHAATRESVEEIQIDDSCIKRGRTGEQQARSSADPSSSNSKEEAEQGRMADGEQEQCQALIP